MLKTFAEASQMISNGKWLHIAGNEDLLKRLPAGNWIGGSTEYFMSAAGGIVTNDQLFIQEIPSPTCKISVYDENNISDITKDAFDNGFSIVILPFDSTVHKVYAEKAAEFEDIFLKNIVGWVSGLNLSVAGQTPIAVSGEQVVSYSDKAVVLHVFMPEDRLVNIGIVNIFTPNEDGPVFEFSEDSFSVEKCFVDGQEVVFSDYIAKNNLNTQLPLIGDYSGIGINTSYKKIENGVVYFYAPVFKGIKYRMANEIADYAAEFKRMLAQFSDMNTTFSCNCILNFLYGELEGKQIDYFHGPITFGEVAYQLVNQTLVYLVIS